MARAYPFLDIVVLDGVRERFVAGDALVILSADLSRIVWANGAGAELFGFASVEEAVDQHPGFSRVAIRQLNALPGFPRIGKNRAVAVRLSSGLAFFHASAFTLPGGEEALLLAAAPAEELAAAERARRVISGIAGPGQFAALVDAKGSIEAASSNFASLKLDSSAISSLLEDVRQGEARLAKGRLSAGRNLPAGIARLTDDPELHLLVIVDDQPVVAEPEASTEPLSRDAELEPVAPPISETPVHPDNSVVAKSFSQENPTVRFSWRTDAEGRFTSISSEFGEAVGEPAADVIGRTFREVANTFGLDNDGAIYRLMERRDTWSGRTVMWPLAGTRLKVPVDLAGLPVYGRGKVFEGFRGFGMIRMNEAVEDPEGIGEVLRAITPDQGPRETPYTTTPIIDELTKDPFAGERPALEIPQEHTRRAADKEAAQAIEKTYGLSQAERLAFREIGERLRRANEALAARNQELAAEDITGEQEATELPELAPVMPDAVLPPVEDHPEDAPESFSEPDNAKDLPATQFSNEAEETTPADKTVEMPGAWFAPAPEPKPVQAPAAQPRRSRSLLSLVPARKHEKPAKASRSLAAATALKAEPAPSQELDDLVAHLPVPLLIHSGDELHFANREFLQLTGYADLPSLAAAGGIGALFEDAPDFRVHDETTLTLRTATGTAVPVQTRLQSVRWHGRKTLMLALKPVIRTQYREAFEHETSPFGLGLREMQTIVDTAADGVIIISNEGDIRSLNAPAEALFGFNAENVIGKNFSVLFAIESKRTVQEYVVAMGERGANSILNDGRHVIGREAHGRFIPLFITLARLPENQGYCAVLRDISHWKRIEDELNQARSQAEQASSHKSDFLARVSHEIRTPLNAIIGFSELMIDEKFGPIGNDRYRDYLRDINRSGNHVLDLVNDLLDISKIEAGQQEMHFESISLNEALEQAVSMMQPQANSERVIIRSSFGTRIPNVVADLRSIRQIALNLLSNAVRYTPAGGQIVVSTAYQPEGSVVLRIRDTGIGMNPTELEEALKPFRQINALRRKRGDGTGLGLPLTRAMVEANRAFFSISSTPGEGTLVEITFPPTRVLADT